MSGTVIDREVGEHPNVPSPKVFRKEIWPPRDNEKR